jgi:ADP-heptose:LPS heptosyltransferase
VRRLIIRPGAIGDFIVSIPAMESLREDHLEVWARTPNVTLARFAHRARSIEGTGLDLLGVADPPERLIEELRGFDDIVSWYGANRDEFRALVESLGLPFRFFPALPSTECGTHAVDFYCEQVGAIPAAPHIAVSSCRRVAASPVVIHPFSGSPRKNWPLERFRELAARLEHVEWCAGPEDDFACAVRIDDLYKLGCWLAGARVYIGNDSGIAHLAAAVGTPVVALFGPTDPRVWAPPGSNVRVIARPTMAEISVDEVLAQVLEFVP